MSGRIDKGMSDAGRRMYLSSNVNQTPLGIEKAVDTVTILKEYFAVTCFSFLSFVSSLLLRMLYVRSDRHVEVIVRSRDGRRVAGLRMWISNFSQIGSLLHGPTAMEYKMPAILSLHSLPPCLPLSPPVYSFPLPQRLFSRLLSSPCLFPVHTPGLSRSVLLTPTSLHRYL